MKCLSPDMFANFQRFKKSKSYRKLVVASVYTVISPTPPIHEIGKVVTTLSIF